MNKKIIIASLISLVIAMLFLWYIPRNKVTQVEFFSENQIKSSDIVIKKTSDGFVPAELTIKKGTRVVWVNKTVTYIWPASDLHPLHTEYPEFDPQEPFETGEAWAFTFERVGTWKYHDHLRPNRRGTIKVLE